MFFKEWILKSIAFIREKRITLHSYVKKKPFATAFNLDKRVTSFVYKRVFLNVLKVKDSPVWKKLYLKAYFKRFSWWSSRREVQIWKSLYVVKTTILLLPTKSIWLLLILWVKKNCGIRWNFIIWTAKNMVLLHIWRCIHELTSICLSLSLYLSIAFKKPHALHVLCNSNARLLFQWEAIFLFFQTSNMPYFDLLCQWDSY